MVEPLGHVPRRGVQAAKALRRMGLRVVRADTQEDEVSSSDVKQVTDSARTIAKVGADARRVRQKLDESISEINQALGVAEEVADALRSAGAELRGVLGAQTNSPPSDGEDAAGGTAADK